MDNQIYIQGCHNWLIVSPTPITEAVSRRLQEGYKMLSFQVLSEKPMICVSDKSKQGNEPTYPIVYPGTTIVPESEWGRVSIVCETILINNVFVSRLLGKSAYEISLTDLLAVFEVLADTEKLADFGDTHGLIIVGCNPD